MARKKYGLYRNEENHCYVISNAGMKYAEDIANETFTNLPIKMVVKSFSHSWEYTFNASDNPCNHPEIQDNLIKILRGELPEWRLTGVNVSKYGIYLVYYTTGSKVISDDGSETYSGGQICVYGDCTLLFEVAHSDSPLPKQYRVKVLKVPGVMDPSTKVTKVQITEYIGKRRCRTLEIREDNHGKPYIAGQQYCVITEY